MVVRRGICVIGALLLTVGLGACTSPLDVLRSRYEAARAVPAEKAAPTSTQPPAVPQESQAPFPGPPQQTQGAPAEDSEELQPQATQPPAPQQTTRDQAPQPQATQPRPTQAPTTRSQPTQAAPTRPAAAGQCTPEHLTLAVTPDPAASGSDYDAYLLWLKNSSTSSCKVKGFPGVDFITSEGTQIGADGSRDRRYEPNEITLDPGEQAASEIHIKRPSAISNCRAASGYGIQVIPPNTTMHRYYEIPGLQVCANAADKQLSVRSVRFVG